jgi:hypothetical protein
MFVYPTTGPSRPRRAVGQISANLAARVRPVSLAQTRRLPVPPALVGLFPEGALRRGSTTVVGAEPGRGGTTLALALLASATTSGCWCAAVGLPDPGVVAMAELGIDLRRVVFVPRPKAGWAEAAGELLNGVDVVLVRPPGRARLTAARHLAARARERQAVLLVLADRVEDWPIGSEVALRVTTTQWHGAGSEHGPLRGRRAEIRVTGKGSAASPALHSLWLPSPSGAVAVDSGSLGE